MRKRFSCTLRSPGSLFCRLTAKNRDQLRNPTLVIEYGYLFCSPLLSAAKLTAGRADLFERHFSAAVVCADDIVGTRLHSFLDEAQQVLLVHARRRVHVRVHL